MSDTGKEHISMQDEDCSTDYIIPNPTNQSANTDYMKPNPPNQSANTDYVKPNPTNQSASTDYMKPNPPNQSASTDYMIPNPTNQPCNNHGSRMTQYVNQSNYINEVIPPDKNVLKDQTIHPFLNLGDCNKPREQTYKHNELNQETNIIQNKMREQSYKRIDSWESDNQYEEVKEAPRYIVQRPEQVHDQEEVRKAPPYVAKRPELVHDHELPSSIKERFSYCKVVVIIAVLVLFACVTVSVTLIVIYMTKEQMIYNTNEQGEPLLGSTTSGNDIVGFTAYKQTTQSDSPSTPFVHFETYIFNGYGNNFNGTHFTCPSDAVYFVQLSAKSSTRYMCLKVARHGLNVLHLCNEFNAFTAVSNMAITSCLKGEHIYVEPYSPDRPLSVFGEQWIPVTTLTIFKIEEKASMSVLKDKPQTYIKSDIVTYETIIYDKQQMFNRDTSTIQCKTSGLYLMSITSKKSDINLQISVRKNTQDILHSVNAHNEISNLDFVNNRLVVCHQGDNISVVATGSGAIWNYDSSITMMLVHRQGNSEEFKGMSVMKSINQAYKSGDSITFESNLIESASNQPTLSSYTCVVNGVYLVLANFVKVLGADMNIDVLVQNRLLFRLSDSRNRSPEATLSNNVLFKCNQGERVHVVAFGQGAVMGDTEKILTTFTVMLIRGDHIIT